MDRVFFDMKEARTKGLYIAFVRSVACKTVYILPALFSEEASPGK